MSEDSQRAAEALDQAAREGPLVSQARGLWRTTEEVMEDFRRAYFARHVSVVSGGSFPPATGVSDDEAVTEPEPKTLEEARRMVSRLRRERDEARRHMHAFQAQCDEARHRAALGERYHAVLMEILPLFVEPAGGGFVRSVNVSLDDYHAWCRLARLGRETGEDDTA